MFNLEEHERKALQHARDIRWRQFRWLIVLAPLVFFVIGALWSMNRSPREIPPPPIQEEVQPPPPEQKQKPTPPVERKHSPKRISAAPSPTVLLKSVVHIQTNFGSGSGVVIVSTPETRVSLILTAAHVVARSDLVSIGKASGVVVYRDTSIDLALIRTDVYFQDVDLTMAYAPGDEVWSVGIPDDKHIIGQGRITKISPDFRATAPVYFGMSGGGMFVLRDGRFELAAIISSVGKCAARCFLITDSRAVPATTIYAFMRRAVDAP
jgi:trypsin-like peptidase